jgi:RNA recognition motif-containing protein
MSAPKIGGLAIKTDLPTIHELWHRYRNLIFFCLLLFSNHQLIPVMNIYVSNLSSIIQNDDLKSMFAVYGDVKSARIVKDIISGESRGFGYIEMENDMAAQRAIDALHQTEVDTLSVSVEQDG